MKIIFLLVGFIFVGLTGQTVTVLYNRENPGEAQIDRGLANYWLTAALGFGGGLFTLLGLHSARRRRVRGFNGSKAIDS